MCAATAEGGRQDDLQARARDILIERARAGETASYAEMAAALDLSPQSPRVTETLNEVSRSEDAAGRGMLSVLVVRGRQGTPGSGFYTLARELGREFDDEEQFFNEERARVNAHWQGQQEEPPATAPEEPEEADAATAEESPAVTMEVPAQPAEQPEPPPAEPAAAPSQTDAPEAEAVPAQAEASLQQQAREVASRSKEIAADGARKAKDGARKAWDSARKAVNDAQIPERGRRLWRSISNSISRRRGGGGSNSDSDPS